jgi:hypothetical protein
MKILAEIRPALPSDAEEISRCVLCAKQTDGIILPMW